MTDVCMSKTQIKDAVLYQEQQLNFLFFTVFILSTFNNIYLYLTIEGFVDELF